MSNEDKQMLAIVVIVTLICLFAIGYINMNPEMFQASR